MFFITKFEVSIELGLWTKKIPKVLKFEQNKWLKNCIDFNTEKKTNSKNDFKKTFLNWWTTQSFVKQLRMFGKANRQTCIKLVSNYKNE